MNKEIINEVYNHWNINVNKGYYPNVKELMEKALQLKDKEIMKLINGLIKDTELVIEGSGERIKVFPNVDLLREDNLNFKLELSALKELKVLIKQGVMLDKK